MFLLRLTKATIPIPFNNLDRLCVFLSSEPRLLFSAQPCNCLSVHYPRSLFPASGRARKSAAYHNHTRRNITNFRRPFPAKYLIPPQDLSLTSGPTPRLGHLHTTPWWTTHPSQGRIAAACQHTIRHSILVQQRQVTWLPSGISKCSCS